MKIRNGFVSNSSSSSFLLYGVYDPKMPDAKEFVEKFIDLKELEEKWNVWYNEQQERYKETYPHWYPDTTFEDWLESELSEGIQELIEGNVFSLVDKDFSFSWYSPFNEYNYIGVDPRNMKMDETMSEFQERVKNMLGEIFGNDIKCGWMEYAWRNG